MALPRRKSVRFAEASSGGQRRFGVVWSSHEAENQFPGKNKIIVEFRAGYSHLSIGK